MCPLQDHGGLQVALDRGLGTGDLQWPTHHIPADMLRSSIKFDHNSSVKTIIDSRLRTFVFQGGPERQPHLRSDWLRCINCPFAQNAIK